MAPVSGRASGRPGDRPARHVAPRPRIDYPWCAVEELGDDAIICVPTFNEAENIALLLPAIFGELPRAHVLIVDDNSPDGTGAIADRIAARDPRVHVLHRAGKEGLGPAYVAAFRWVLERDYRYVFQFDADFSHNPSYLAPFLRLLRTEADVVVGSRRVAGGGVQDWNAVRRAISWGGSQFARRMLHLPIHDVTGGFNGFRRSVLEAISLDRIAATGYGFQIELKFRCVEAGFRVAERPIIFPDRERGHSKMSAAIFGEALTRVLQLRWQRHRAR